MSALCLQARVAWCKFHTKKSNKEFVQKCKDNQCQPLGKEAWTSIANSIMDNVATATTLGGAEHRAAVVDEVLRLQHINATAPACIKPIILENGLQEVAWMGTSYVLQLDSAGRQLNPFYFPEMADRYKFWWKHLVLWAEAIISDRTRNCNATSEVVNLVLKGNTMHGKCHVATEQYA